MHTSFWRGFRAVLPLLLGVAPFAVDMLRRGEHHHIVPRSRGGEDSTANVILISLEMHKAIHAGKVRVEGNADEALTIYRRSEDGTWHVWIQEDGCGGVRRD